MLDDRYAAGIFDGEGYVRIARWAKPGSVHVRYQVFIGVGMTFQPVIEALRATYGGNINVNRHSRRNPIHRDQFVWNVSSQLASTFLKAILPYTIVKRDEILLAVDLQNSINKWKHKLGHHHRLAPDRDEVFAYRESLFHRISALKHRTFSITRGPGDSVNAH